MWSAIKNIKEAFFLALTFGTTFSISIYITLAQGNFYSGSETLTAGRMLFNFGREADFRARFNVFSVSNSI